MRRKKTVLIAVVISLVATLAMAMPESYYSIFFYDAYDNLIGQEWTNCSNYNVAYYGDTSGDKYIVGATIMCDNSGSYVSCDVGQTPVYYDYNTAPSYCASPGWIDCYRAGYCGHAEGLHPDQW